jgi:hypothetical protein
MQAILAPVPCLHLVGALEVIGKHGVVAFGSQAGFFFLNDDGECTFPSGMNVLITASRPELGHAELYNHGYVNFRGNFIRWTFANSRGEHPKPELRPVSTQHDTPFLGFWEVAKLQPLSPPIPLQKFLSASDHKPVVTIPRGPSEVIWDDGD